MYNLKMTAKQIVAAEAEGIWQLRATSGHVPQVPGHLHVT